MKKFEVRIAIISPHDFDCDDFTTTIHDVIGKYGIRIGV